MDDRRRERLERILDGYFDSRTATLVRRALDLLSPEDLEDAAAVDGLFDDFVTVLEERYHRNDPDWAPSAATFLRAEWDRQVEQAREFNASMEDLA